MIPCLLLAFGYFSYVVLLLPLQILDCVDGKHARRTKNSSPLGLLFDHGADACNTVLIVMSLAALFQAGNGWPLHLLFVPVISGFFFATLEEYYTGKLDLPSINAVSDGAVLILVIHLISAFAGIILHSRPKAAGYGLIQFIQTSP